MRCCFSIAPTPSPAYSWERAVQKRWQTPCDRTYSALGCLWGHFVDRCGSVRPAQLLADFKNTHAEMRSLPTMRTIAVSNFLKTEMARAGYPADRIDVISPPVARVE